MANKRHDTKLAIELAAKLNPQIKACWSTGFNGARLMVDKLNHVRYTEGYVYILSGTLPIEHAWFEYEDDHSNIMIVDAQLASLHSNDGDDNYEDEYPAENYVSVFEFGVSRMKGSDFYKKQGTQFGRLHQEASFWRHAGFNNKTAHELTRLAQQYNNIAMLALTMRTTVLRAAAQYNMTEGAIADMQQKLQIAGGMFMNLVDI